jgi:hypothetical protein
VTVRSAALEQVSHLTADTSARRVQCLTQQPPDVADVLANGVVPERTTGSFESLVHDRSHTIERCFSLAAVAGLLDMHLSLRASTSALLATSCHCADDSLMVSSLPARHNLPAVRWALHPTWSPSS